MGRNSGSENKKRPGGESLRTLWRNVVIWAKRGPGVKRKLQRAADDASFGAVFRRFHDADDRPGTRLHLPLNAVMPLRPPQVGKRIKRDADEFG